MSDISTVLITAAIGLVLFVGAVVAVYLNGLVRNAYDLRVAIRNEIEERLRQVQEESEKKVRWLRRELVEEVEKMRESVGETNQRRLAELVEKIEARFAEFQKQGQFERVELRSAVDELREAAAKLDARVGQAGRETRALAEALQASLAQDARGSITQMPIAEPPAAGDPNSAPPASNAA